MPVDFEPNKIYSKGMPDTLLDRSPTDSEIETPSQAKTLLEPMTRREFIKGATTTLLGAAFLPSLGISPGIPKDLLTIKPEQIDPSETEARNHLSTPDLITSSLTASEFGILIGGIVKGQWNFGPGTVIAMTAGEAARLVILSMTDPEIANHEIQEHLSSYPLVFGLAVLAETASHIKVSNDQIFNNSEVVREITKEFGIGEEDNSNTLQESENLEVWENHLKEISSRLTTTVARNAALTTTLAPLGTTYSSSAIANSNFEVILTTLVELNYAKRVVEIKKKAESRGDIFVFEGNDIEKLKKEAKKQSIDQMNGKDGYIHLNLALASNTNGNALIGDPPFLYFLKNHPDFFLKASAFGLAASEITTIAMNYYWLARVGGGIEAASFLPQFIQNEYKTLQTLSSSVKNGALRDVSFCGGREAAKALTRKLESLQENQTNEDKQEFAKQSINTINQLLHSIPEPALYLDVKGIIKQKSGILAGYLKGEKIDTISRQLSGMPLEEFLTSIKSKGGSSIQKPRHPKEFRNSVNTLHSSAVDQQTSHLTALFELLLSEKEGDLPNLEEIFHQLTAIPISTDLPTKEFYYDLVNGLTSHDIEKLKDNDLQNLSEAAAKVYSLLGTVGAEQVKKALEDSLLLAEGQESEHQDKSLLGHQAKDVLYALLSQIPAVPSLVKMATLILPKLAGVNTKEGPTKIQLETMTNSTLITIAVISGVADNVAAYLFGEQVLTNMYKEFYGEDVFDKHPELFEVLTMSALYMAVEGGSLSKAGNGPNFMLSRFDDEGNQVDMNLGSTLFNAYSWVQNAAFYSILKEQIKQALPT